MFIAKDIQSRREGRRKNPQTFFNYDIFWLFFLIFIAERSPRQKAVRRKTKQTFLITTFSYRSSWYFLLREVQGKAEERPGNFFNFDIFWPFFLISNA